MKVSISGNQPAGLPELCPGQRLLEVPLSEGHRLHAPYASFGRNRVRYGSRAPWLRRVPRWRAAFRASTGRLH
jgi:hypothetical protein